MSSHAGLKRVVKTVHTKKGTKRQTFWVKSAPKDAPKSKSAPKAKRASGPSTKDYAKVVAGLGALAATAYGLHKLHKAGMEHMGRTMSRSIAQTRSSGAPASAPKHVTPSGKRSSYDEFMAQPGVHRVGATRHEDFMKQPGVTRVR